MKVIQKTVLTVFSFEIDMSLHSYSKIWIHLVWGTLGRAPMLSRGAAAKASDWLAAYATEKKIYLKANYFNADRVHASIDLPTNLCIEDVVQLFKGASSHWINEQNLVPGKFSWGRGYGAFSVSESAVPEVASRWFNTQLKQGVNKMSPSAPSAI